MLITKSKIMEALEWHIKHYTVTSNRNSVEVMERGSLFVVKFGTLADDGYVVSIRHNDRLQNINITVSDSKEHVTSTKFELLLDFVTMTGGLKTFIQNSLEELELKAQRRMKHLPDTRKDRIEVHVENIVSELRSIDMRLDLHRNNTGHYPNLDSLVQARKQLDAILTKTGANEKKLVVIDANPIL